MISASRCSCYSQCLRCDWADISSVPTADTLLKLKSTAIILYFDSAHSHGLRRRSARGTVAQCNNPWLARTNDMK